MVILVTATDAKISPASRLFADMTESSFAMRSAKTKTIIPNLHPKLVNAATSDSANSDFALDLFRESKEAIFHIDIRSYEGSETTQELGSKDFIVAATAEVTDPKLNSQLVNALNDFSEVSEMTVDTSSMYTSTFTSLLIGIPTITILINEDSLDLYRAGADALAEVAEAYLRYQ